MKTKNHAYCVEMNDKEEVLFFKKCTIYPASDINKCTPTQADITMGTKKKRSAVNSQYHRIYLDIKLTIK